jgi:peptidoglycan/LPS O-acetylase OafA/YrhL
MIDNVEGRYAGSEMTNPLSLTSRDRFAALDGLRGAAALSVVIFHINWTNHFSDLKLVHNFYTAVDLFFILSGFVISVSYYDKICSLQNIKTFLIRRLFRVYPLHLVILLALVSIEASKYIIIMRGGHLEHAPFTETNSVKTLLENLLFLHGTGLTEGTSWNVPSWSVSSEFVAYVLFAVFCFLGALRYTGFVVAVAVFGFVAYGLLAWNKESLDFSYDYGIIRCLSGFSIGVAIDHLRRRQLFAGLNGFSYSAMSVCEFFVLLLLIIFMSFGNTSLIFFVVPCFTALVILLQCEGGALSRFLKSRHLEFLGLISYSVYLIHVPLRGVVSSTLHRAGIPAHTTSLKQTFLDINPWLGDLLIVVFIAIVIAAASVTYKYIEKPGRDFGRRLSQRRLVRQPRPFEA